jgi:hypothetical protein
MSSASNDNKESLTKTESKIEQILSLGAAGSLMRSDAIEMYVFFFFSLRFELF